VSDSIPRSGAAAIARAVIALGALAAAGCGGRTALSGGRSDGGSACPAHWSVSDTHANPALAVAIGGGALTIAAPLAGDELVYVVHDGHLTGDFEVAFDFDVFAPGQSAAYLQATLGLRDPNLADVPYIGAGIGVDDGATDVRTMFVYHDETRTRFDLALTDAAAGTLRLARAGRRITLDATVASGATATVSEDVSDAPASIGVQFASGSTTAPTDDASVRLTEFRVTGGGGAVAPDPFDCDSLASE